MFTFFSNFLYFLLIVLLIGCQNKSELSSPPEYDLNRPSTIKLPAYLDEISGVVYYPKDKSVFGICDDKSWLYKIFLSDDGSIQKWKLGDKGDFEDIVLVDSTFYVLQSKGRILSLEFVSPDSITVKEYELAAESTGEFEILYFEKEKNRLVMLCKECKADDKNSLTAWAFDLKTLTFSTSPAYVIDVRKIEELMQEKKVKFKPSAASIHPLTGQLFIISSINKALVIAGKEGVTEKVYKIDPALYKQPEGLTFSPEGHLIISNEAANSGAANILVFKYNKGR
jgi:hypothetical protein